MLFFVGGGTSYILAFDNGKTGTVMSCCKIDVYMDITTEKDELLT